MAFCEAHLSPHLKYYSFTFFVHVAFVLQNTCIKSGFAYCLDFTIQVFWTLVYKPKIIDTEFKYSLSNLPSLH